MGKKPKDTAEVIAAPPLIYGGAFFIGTLLQCAEPVQLLPTALARIVGWSLITLAAFPVVMAVIALKRAGTPVNPFKSTTSLVVEGPYRLSRNPMYLSLTLLYAGAGVLLNLMWTFVLLPGALAIMHYGVILREERYLEEKFGQAYQRYRAKVRRWI